jgi:PPOX class probable F420-dependent enzyme
MSADLDQTTRDLVAGPNFAHVSVTRPDGSILTAVAWVDLEGDKLVVSTVRGRGWPSQLERNGTATISIHNQENPYSYTAIETRLVETRKGEDNAVILKRLCQKYMGTDELPGAEPGEDRAAYVLEPIRVNTMG